MATDYTARLGALQKLDGLHGMELDEAAYWFERAVLERDGAFAMAVWLTGAISEGIDPLQAVMQASRAAMAHQHRIDAARIELQQRALDKLRAEGEA